VAITTSMSTSFKKELMQGTHNFNNSGGDTFKFPLYTSSATLGASTTSYSSTNEVANGNGYTTGGNTLTRVDPTTSGTTAYTDFADTSWSSSSFTANGGGIYNSTDSNTWVSAHAFGGDVTSSSGTFTVTMPTPDASNAILRLA